MLARAAVLLALFFSPSRASEERESFQQAACAADGPSPLFALLLVGNFRTFYDPRVYKSIRTNLIDALGARSVVFIYGKLDSENVRGRRRDTGAQIRPSDPNFSGHQHRIEEITHAAAHLSAHGGPEVVMDVVNSSRSRTLINPGCPWLAFQGKDRPHWEEGYVGQLQSHAMGFEMMQSYEAQKNVRFDYVAKVRLDAMWISSVRPWCTYRKDAAYVIFPQPADWFQLVPRRMAERSLKGPFARYQSCKAESDMVRFQAQCCGGGPTAQLLGAVMEARVPVIGPEYTGSKWGPAPVGSYVMPWLWPMVVMRDETYNEWCQKELIAPRYPEFPRSQQMWEHWRFFYDQNSCERIIDPEANRYKVPGAHEKQLPPPHGHHLGGGNATHPSVIHHAHPPFYRVEANHKVHLVETHIPDDGGDGAPDDD